MSKSRLTIVLALGLLIGVHARAVDESLVLYLPFDEGDGITARDVSSYNNPGTVVGNAVWVAGQKGTALEFVSGSHVTIPEIPQYDVTAEVSLLAWVKATTVPNWARVIDKSQWQTSGFDLVLTQNVGLPRLEFFVNNTTSLVDGTTVVSDNEWHFLVGTFGDKTLRMYVDGEVEGEAQSFGQVDINPNDWPLMVGAEASSNGGQQYFGSIDEVAMYNRELSADEVMAIFQNGMPARETASDPRPQNGAVDVPRDVVLGWTPGGFAASHDVYLGTSFNEVDGASRDNPMETLVGPGQTATEYEPADLLEYGQTYYWRIDEVNEAPDDAVFKGDVWSFTTEPYAYPITSLTVKASSEQPASAAIRTIDGSGLDASGQHSTDMDDMWIGFLPAWIQYTFDKEYSLHELQVWNANSGIETGMGLGARDVTIEYSTDGETWTPLDNVPEFAQGTGEATYTANTVVDFGGVVAKYVKLTIAASWLSPQMTSLSEVRFSYVPMQAFGPEPADGATDVNIEASLQWRPGREAESHEVYFGSDPNTMTLADATAGHGYTPVSLDLGTTYYWRIDEIGGAGPYDGEVWNFTTEQYLVVDDFESYTNDSPNRLFQAWIDGLGFSPDEFFPDGNDGNGSGSMVGYDPVQGDIVEKTLVHGGRQSMPLYYDNTAASNSETTRTFVAPQDWTAHGITTLVVYFRGQVTNSPASLYLKIDDTKVPFDNDAATAMPVWKQWAVPLAATGANLESVGSVTIGIEGGSTGTVFIDDIRLYAVAPQAVNPVDPGTSGLVALYAMDGNAQDSSGNDYHGTIHGNISYDAGYAGQALVMNGIDTYVDLPIGTELSTMTDTTVATHVYFGGGTGAWQRVFDFGAGTSRYMFFCPRTGTAGIMTFVVRGSTGAEQIVDGPTSLSVGWHHVAVTIDTQTTTTTIYIDGEPVASGGTAQLPRDMGVTDQNWIGKSQYPDALFLGSIDDFRIYNRALSAAEVRYLAGDR